MSSQCFCYSCAGAIVTRKTYVTHGRRDKPDPPKRVCLEAELTSMNDPVKVMEVLDDLNESSDTASEESVEEEVVAEDVEQPGIGRHNLSTSEVTIMILDWMCAHKSTDSSAEDVFGLFSNVLPAGVTMDTFHKVITSPIIVYLPHINIRLKRI